MEIKTFFWVTDKLDRNFDTVTLVKFNSIAIVLGSVVLKYKV